MANKQTRRSVSLSRAMHSASREYAAAQGITHARLCELALQAYGVPCEPGVCVTPEQAAKAMRNRAPRVLSKDEPRKVRTKAWARGEVRSLDDSRRGGGEVRSLDAHRPSLERQLLGDAVANAMGFR